MRYRAAFFLVPAVGASAVGYAASRVQPASAAKPFGTMPVAGGVYTPATSCAAASCHNSGQAGREGGEFTTWSDGDPHRKAYSVLFNADSVRIMKNLAGGDAKRWAAPAHKESLCLKCHAVNEDRYFHGEMLDDRQLGEGVGCDGCHGPSKDWLAAHYQPFWKGLSDREKYDQYKFVPTKDLVSRSLVCAGCHVGQRDREVNHDLIAAGHPRLSFEYTRYHYSSNYPKHWVEKQENPRFELKAWLIGQVASLRAATDLLAKRAEEATEKKAPWPELSEHSCYACHQGIGGASRSATGGRRGRIPGIAGWQVWYSSLSGLLPDAGQGITGQPGPTLAKLGDLRKAMEKTNPDPKAVAALAAAATVELDAWLAAVQAAGSYGPVSPDAAKRLGAIVSASALTDDRSAIRDYDWDYAGQHFLALAAAYHGSGGAGGPLAAWKPAIDELQAKLAFKTDGATRFDSPLSGGPGRYDPASLVKPFQTIYTLTH